MNDLIKREDAKKYFAEFLSLNRFADFKNTNIERLVGKLCERIPSAENKGEWIPIIEANEFGEPYQSGIYCSECGETFGCEANYCPNCGAKMKGADDDAD